MPLPATITAALDRWGGRILQTAEATCPKTADGRLGEMVWYQLDSGGKRLRPLIVLLATEALGGDPEHALPFAAGVELLHNATLVHDDYQDGDVVRRGEPTLWKRYGWEQSINAGDGLYFAGLSLLAKTEIDGDALRKLLSTTSARMTQVIEGQVNEFRLKERAHRDLRPTEADYIEVIRGKTAGLFAMPLEGAAIVAGRSDAEIAAIAEVGDTMGLLFQVQDDLLDLVGDKGRGQVGADIAEGKPSLPVVWAQQNAPADDAAALARIVYKARSETTAAEVEEAIAILERTGAIAHAFARIAAWRAAIETTAGAELRPLLTDVTTAILAPIAHRL